MYISLYSVIRGATLFIAEHHSAGQLEEDLAVQWWGTFGVVLGRWWPICRVAFKGGDEKPN